MNIKSIKSGKINKNKLGYLYLFIGIFFWSTIEITLTLIKNENTSPIIINTFRMLIGGIFLLGYITISGRLNQFKQFIRIFPKYYIPAAIIGLVIGQIIYINGTQKTQPELAATIFSSNPIIISLYMMLFQNEKKTKYKIIGVIIGFLGVLLIITELKFDVFLQEEYLVGNLLVFIGMSLWTLDVILGKLIFNKSQNQKEKDTEKLGENNQKNKKLSNQNKNEHNTLDKEEQKRKENNNQDIAFDSLDFNAATFIIAGLAMVPFLALPSEIEIIPKMTIKAWMGILWLGIITGGIGYLLFFKGIQDIEASEGINAFYFKPVFSTVLSFLIFGNIPSTIFYIGLIIEIFALVLVSKTNKNARKKTNSA